MYTTSPAAAWQGSGLKFWQIYKLQSQLIPGLTTFVWQLQLSGRMRACCEALLLAWGRSCKALATADSVLEIHISKTCREECVVVG